MTLNINTSNNKEITVKINSYIKKIKISSGVKFLKSENCLPLIDDLLKENNLSIKDINQIEVNTGPGSFTGLRVGISIANSLGTLLKIPINGKKIGDLVFPVYN